MSARLERGGALPIYESMEMPLVAVLADMERAGVKVDTALLAAHEPRHGGAAPVADARDPPARQGRVQHQLARPSSREVLFERLELKSGEEDRQDAGRLHRRGRARGAGARPRAAAQILDYRSVQKLKSTYVDALPELVNPETGRIHATFNQTVAATGRLSSTDPNLQNIPIRTRRGPADPRGLRRRAGAPAALRRLQPDRAARARAPLAATRRSSTRSAAGEDVHDRTVARDLRGVLARAARTSSAGSRRWSTTRCSTGRPPSPWRRTSGIERKQAEAFIEAYFARYPRRARASSTRRSSRPRETGNVRTLLGRLRRLPDLRSKNFPVRMEAERRR